MRCMYCGAELAESAYCPSCGRDISVQRQAIVLSGLYYNQGLEKAEVRDLTGAIAMLRRSLKFNKENVEARNLLGLVYFETGEVVAALSEWVISKSVKPEKNPAVRYMDNLQRDGARLDVMTHTIQKFNNALANCRSGNEDVAEIQLKKLLSQNPRYIKACHLLALLYIKKKEYEKARKLLKKAIRVDRTNTTTLRYLREVDTETGVATKLETHFSFFRSSGGDSRADETESVRKEKASLPIRETPFAVTVFSMLAGFLIGASAIWFLFVPVKTALVQQEANRRVIEYSTDMASAEEELQQMTSEIKTSREAMETVNDQIAAYEQKASAYENLAKAVNAYNNNQFDQAVNAIQAVDTSQLSLEAQAIYDSLGGLTVQVMFQNFRSEGMAAYNSGDYEKAITLLEKAKVISGEDYDVLLYLGHAYRMSGDTAEADLNYKRILTLWPDTNRSKVAVDYITDYSGLNVGTASGASNTAGGTASAGTSAAGGGTASAGGSSSGNAGGAAGNTSAGNAGRETDGENNGQ
ncbi:MAG: tetratricopeptide repeat protein [Lachnospiraceae bacterium]|nr:tetratricopeptide repeat protein [Lachnospiraceae bacterium]